MTRAREKKMARDYHGVVLYHTAKIGTSQQNALHTTHYVVL